MSHESIKPEASHDPAALFDAAVVALTKISAIKGRGAGRICRHIAKNTLVKLLPRSERKDLLKFVKETGLGEDLNGLHEEMDHMQREADHARAEAVTWKERFFEKSRQLEELDRHTRKVEASLILLSDELREITSE